MNYQLSNPKHLALSFLFTIATIPLLLGNLPASAKTNGLANHSRPTSMARASGHRNLVSQVQTKLKQQGLYTGKIDGVFGHQTRLGVIDFQRAKGLRADGIIGPKTRVAMGLG